MKHRTAFVVVALMLASTAALAATPPVAQEYAVTWHQVMSHAARLTMLQPQLRVWIDGLFWVAAFTSISAASVNWLRDRGDFWDFTYAILFVATVRAGALAYDGITSSAYGASQAISGLYAAGMLGYPAEPWVELLDVLTHVQLPAMSLWDATVVDVILMFLLMVVTGLLALAAWIAGVYNEWQYFIVKVLGPIFIPFILFRVTREWFMNWLSLFLSVCIFNLVLGVIAPALLLATKIGYGFEHSAPIANQGIVVLQLDSPIAFMAGPAFFLVGILFLFRAPAIAQTLAGTGSSLSLNLRAVTKAVGMVLK